MDASIAPRQLGLGGVIARALRVYRDNYLIFFVILAITRVPQAALDATEAGSPNALLPRFWWRVFGITLVLLLVSRLSSYSGHLVGLGPTEPAYHAVGAAVGMLIGAVTPIGQVVLYFDLKLHKEQAEGEQTDVPPLVATS